MRRVALLACLLTVCITAASAYIRHWQAGLGCAQRADCRVVATSEVAPGQAQTVRQALRRVVSGEAPPAVTMARAVHRLSATVVGVLVVVIGFVGWSALASIDRTAIVAAVVLTVALAWVGIYAAHPSPAVTIANVLGGFTLGGALAWIAAGGDRGGGAPAGRGSGLRGAKRAWAALALVAAIAPLGVLIAARETADTDAASLHLAHRILAFLFAALTIWLIVVLGARAPAITSVLGVAVFLQITLGLTNAFSDTPLVAATAHNAVAALIVALLAACARRAVAQSAIRAATARP